MRSVSRLVKRLPSLHVSFRGFASDVAPQQTPVHSQKGWSIWSKIALVTPPVLVAGWIGLSNEPQRRARVAYNVPLRVCRDAITVLSIASGLPILQRFFCLLIVCIHLLHILIQLARVCMSVRHCRPGHATAHRDFLLVHCSSL